MEKKFFKRRFYHYFLLLIIPVFCVCVISFCIVSSRIDRELSTRANNTLANVNTNLDMVISNIVLQNNQLTNNSYTNLALKKLLERTTNIQYSDAIYLRNIQTMLRSITQSYPYIDSVYLYLDDADNYLSSEEGVCGFWVEEDREWLANYQGMDKQENNAVEVRSVYRVNKEKQLLTIYERMNLIDGVIVMNIEIEKYKALLNSILATDYEMIQFYDNEGTYLFTWNDLDTEEANEMMEQRMQQLQHGKWVTLNHQKYLYHSTVNTQYGVQLVSFISYYAKWETLMQLLKLFSLVFVLCKLGTIVLAYITTKQNFTQLHYLIQVFHEAERDRKSVV